MKIKLRLETEKDYRRVEEITREAFWGVMGPKCDEHYLAHILRKSDDFIKELDYVAEIDGKIIGNIMYAKGRVVDGDNNYDVIGFGPLTVLPEYQKCGVGKALVTHTIDKAKELGYKVIVIFGHPDYYPRYGFKKAKDYAITTSTGHNFDAFMVLPLVDDISNIKGKFYESEVYEFDKSSVEEFDKTFPYKEPGSMTPISVLLSRLPAPAKRAFEGNNIKYLEDLTRYSRAEISSWHGIGANTLKVIDEVLVENGYAKKLDEGGKK